MNEYIIKVQEVHEATYLVKGTDPDDALDRYTSGSIGERIDLTFLEDVMDSAEVSK